MNFEQLLVNYLYQHKHVSLQGFGTITLSSSIPDAEIISKNRHIPVEGVSFKFNPKVNTDEGFVQFFSQQKGKIKPLAESDIESHLQLAKQLMNIGKPYEVEGLGSFALTKDGGMMLHLGHYSVPATEPSVQQSRLKERTEQEERELAERESGGVSNGVKKALIAVVVLLVLAIAGWLIYANYGANKPVAGSLQDSTVVSADTVPAPNTDTVPANAAAALPDTTPTWKVYIRDFNGSDRVESLKRYYSKFDSTVKVQTADSITFRLFVLAKKSTADTTLLRDSLGVLFARPAASLVLEKQ